MELIDTFKILYGLIQDLANTPDGLSTGEIAQSYAISSRAALKYIGILENAGIPIYTDRKRYFLDAGYFSAFTLSADESEVLFLVLEHALVYQAETWLTLSSVVRKLGSKMTAPLADYLKPQSIFNNANSRRNEWFTSLAIAKRNRKEVWVDYHPLNRPQPSRWRIRPFRFRSNPLSDGLYVLCEGSQDGLNYIPLSLRFDRILGVETTNTTFDIASMARFASFDGSAWGVWNSDRPPTSVVLQFEPRHYDRLLESVWHSTQRLSVDNDGYVTFRVEVSEPDERVPWIRSWGSGVVVIEPTSLRERMIRSLQRQLQAYGLTLASDDGAVTPLDYLWAKYDRRTKAHHRLVYHLLDVAAVAWVMWEQVFTQAQRDWLSSQLGMEHEEAQRLIAFFTGLHDIGKATPAFQRKAPILYEQVIAAGLVEEQSFDTQHGALSALILDRLFTEHGLKAQAAKPLAWAIGGHHGEWIRQTKLDQSRADIGRDTWRTAQSKMFTLLKETLAVDRLVLPTDLTQRNIFTVFISGFVSVCDWIGSNNTYFPFETTSIDANTYFQRALQQATAALGEMGWFSWQKPGKTIPFESMFPFPPNALQGAAISACQFNTEPPRLILVEYLTGGGKTELALFLADLLANRFDQAGIYVAMPTQATSNQMFDRVTNFLNTRYPGQLINTQLIHAEADYHPLYHPPQPATGYEGDDSSGAAAVWFQHRKRSLLAPFAVGTIDQAMLSVLQAKHHFVRQFALSHKTIIFDEIHAYDTYMNQIIERLMAWLTALHSPMILLSATLPRSSRMKMLAQVGARPSEMADIAYPRLTIVDRTGAVQVHALPATETRTLHLHYIEGDIESLCQFVTSIYQDGGCIAVICNTVDECIRVAQRMMEDPLIDPEDVIVFHARFPSAWRRNIEPMVLSRFGKTGPRPARAIVIATQIIEQSLDLDFDLIITSTAPIDLLIQRAGRLHRHERLRPEHLAQPVLVVRSPLFTESDSDVPDFGVDEAMIGTP